MGIRARNELGPQRRFGSGGGVLLAGRSPERLLSAAAHVGEVGGIGVMDERVRTVTVDLARLDSVREAAARVRDLTDGLDAVVNNAGVMGVARTLTVEGFEEHIATNLIGHVLLDRLLFDLVTARAGRVVTVGSMIHRIAPPLDVSDLMSERSGDPDPCPFIARLASRGVAPLVFTSDVRPYPIRRAVAAGARGLALKSDPVDTLVETILEVAAGNFVASRELAYVLLTDENAMAQLADREIQVLHRLAEGVPRKSIGARLDPPVATSMVVTYVNRLHDRGPSAARSTRPPRPFARLRPTATSEPHFSYR